MISDLVDPKSESGSQSRRLSMTPPENRFTLFLL